MGVIEHEPNEVGLSAPSNKNIKKIVMDVDEEGSLNVIPTIIEEPASSEVETA